MSPALDMPLNRREAVASLLAMLAFVMGVSDTDAADFSPDSGGNSEPIEQPAPSSSLHWGAEMSFFAQDEHLPIPRNLDVMADLVFDGQTIRMDLRIDPYPAWKDGVEIPPIPLGSFVYTGNPAAFFDEISSDADGEWLKKQMRWAERPFTFCPVCLCGNEKRPWCENCGGTGWIHFTPEEGRAMVQQEVDARKALIDAAWQGHQPAEGWER